MKNTFVSALAALATSALAAPTPSRRQAADGPVGYASLNGGTTGGQGGTTTTVSSLAEFTAAVEADGPKVVYVSGILSGGDEKIRPTSDTSIIGVDGDSGLEGVGLYIRQVSNVIVQNVKISKVPADAGDAIGIDESTNVWVDHVELSSDLSADKDFYDGLFDVTHGSDYVTLSNSYLHDHHKVSLVGHSDSNADEDTGHLTVTYAKNHWANIGSRGPSVRFGKVHIYNNYYENVDIGGVNTRMGAQVLVESTQFVNAKSPITSKDSDETGTAETNDVDLGGAENDAPVGSGFEVEYEYTLLGSDAVKAAVVGSAGATL